MSGDRVDWSKKGVWVSMPKTNREKFLPCPDAFMIKLAERESKARSRHIVEYRGKPVGGIRVGWNLAVKRAGIPYHTTPYDIRHLAITELLTRGVDPGAVADIAGHANPFFTITRYHHVQEGAKRQAIDQLPSLQGGAMKCVTILRATRHRTKGPDNYVVLAVAELDGEEVELVFFPNEVRRLPPLKGLCGRSCVLFLRECDQHAGGRGKGAPRAFFARIDES